MHIAIQRYLLRFFLRTIPVIGLVVLISVKASAQSTLRNVKAHYHLNPLLLSSFKKTIKPDPVLYEHLKPTKWEVICFSLYPLPLNETIRRMEENKQPLGKKIVNDIVDSYISSLLNNRNKSVDVVIPKF